MIRDALVVLLVVLGVLALGVAIGQMECPACPECPPCPPPVLSIARDPLLAWIYVDIVDTNGAIIRDANGGFVELQRLIENEWHGYQSNLMSGGSQQLSMRHPGTYRVVWFAGGTIWRDAVTGEAYSDSITFPNGADQRVMFVLVRTAATSIPSPTLTTWPTLTPRPSKTPTPKITATRRPTPSLFPPTCTPTPDSMPTSVPTLQGTPGTVVVPIDDWRAGAVYGQVVIWLERMQGGDEPGTVSTIWHAARMDGALWSVTPEFGLTTKDPDGNEYHCVGQGWLKPVRGWPHLALVAYVQFDDDPYTVGYVNGEGLK